jgi:hypothetical protein
MPKVVVGSVLENILVAALSISPKNPVSGAIV